VLYELAQAARELISEHVTVDVVAVDAASRDRSVEIATETCDQLGLRLSIVGTSATTAWATQRVGFEHALKHSAPDFLVTLDPAGHHDARQLVDLVRVFRSKGAGLTIGSRWIGGGAAPGTPPVRGALSRLASVLVARATGLGNVRDVTTSFRVIRSDAAALIAATPATTGDYGFYCEFAAAAQAFGFTVTEVPIEFRPRFSDVTPLRPSDLWEFARDLARIRSRMRSIRAEMRIDQATWAARSGRMREQSPEIGSEFGALDELTELSDASNFTRWIVDAIDEPAATHVLEVGAGMGAVAIELARRRADRTVVAIEPAQNVFARLRERTATVPNLVTRQITSGQLVAEQGGSFDEVVYVNVLEHIRDDSAELSTATQLLRPGGRLSIFVPAMPSLYGSLDYKSGHYRRYTSDQLRALLATAGYRDVDVRYLDVVGVAPYWLLYRLLDVKHLDRASATGYDRVLVPLSRAVQRLVPRPPFGKNLVATARR
jgi:SAM-dependent methyltransferase